MKVFKFNNMTFAVELKWESVDGSSRNAIKRKIKRKILNRDRDYFHGAFLNTFKSLKRTQFTYTSSKSFYGKVIFPLATFFVEDFKGHVVIKKIEEYKEDGISRILYWLCVIDANGIIVEDMTINDERIEGKISDYLEVGYKLASYKNDYRVYSNDIQISLIYNDSVFNADVDYLKNASFDFYKKENYRKIYQWIFLSVLLAGGGGAFFTMYDTDDKKRIMVENPLTDVENKARMVSQWQESNEQLTENRRGSRGRQSSSPVYAQEEFEDFAKKQIQTKFDSQRYDNITILSNIIQLEQSFPMYLSEWELTQMVYLNNKFFIKFEKISGSNGVFTELDHLIRRYNEILDFKIKPLALEEGANARIFEIQFSNFKRGLSDIGDTLTLFELRAAQKDAVEDIMARVRQSENKIRNIKNQVSNLSTFEQLFSNKLSVFEKEIQNEVSFLDTLYSEALVEIGKQIDNFEMGIALERLTRMRYIEKAQINSAFNWSYPSDPLKYPTINQSGMNYYANSYEVSISSVMDLSNNFESMLEAGFEITGMNTIINQVDYDIKTGEWFISGELFELVD